jgi:hypothetical protein
MKPMGSMTIGPESPELPLMTGCVGAIALICFSATAGLFAIPVAAGALLAVALHHSRCRARIRLTLGDCRQ